MAGFLFGGDFLVSPATHTTSRPPFFAVFMLTYSITTKQVWAFMFSTYTHVGYSSI